MIVIDSNIWAYYFDQTLPEHKPVVEALRRVLHKEKIMITVIIAVETFHYLVKRLGPLIGKEKADIFLNYDFEIIPLTEGMLEDTLKHLALNSHLGIGGRDATIITAMKANNIKKIMTHDQSFKIVADIEVLDPIFT